MSACKDCSVECVGNQCDWCAGWDDGIRAILQELTPKERERVLAKNESAATAWARRPEAT